MNPFPASVSVAGPLSMIKLSGVTPSKTGRGATAGSLGSSVLQPIDDSSKRVAKRRTCLEPAMLGQDFIVFAQREWISTDKVAQKILELAPH